MGTPTLFGDSIMYSKVISPPASTMACGAIASDPAKHEKLIASIIAALVIFVVFLLWGWARHLYTARNVLAPIAINVILVVWIWASRRQTLNVEEAGLEERRRSPHTS